MTTDICAECNGDIVWDSDAGSAVCIGCGTLRDPAQVVLDSHLDTVDKPYDNYGHIFPTGSSSVGFRNQTRWHLAGESKQAAAESNKVGFICDLTGHLRVTDSFSSPNYPASPQISPTDYHEALYCGLS